MDNTLLIYIFFAIVGLTIVLMALPTMIARSRKNK